MYADYAKIRDAAGLSDFAVAKKAGISPSTLSDWKTGKSQIKSDKIAKIADVLGVTSDDIMGRVTTYASEQTNRLMAYYTALTQSEKLQELVAVTQSLDSDDQSLLIEFAKRLLK